MSSTPVFLESKHNELRAAWAATTVGSLLKSHWKSGGGKLEVVTVDATMSAEDAFDVLVQNNINAAPVWDPAAHEYVGMVSMLDVVEFVLMLVKANKAVLQAMDAELDQSTSADRIDMSRPASTAAPAPLAARSQSAHATSAKEADGSGLKIAEIASRIRQIKPIPVSYISDLAKRDPLMSLPRDATLDKAIDIFSKGIHRIAVTESDSNSTLVGILTQSDIVRHLSENAVAEPFASLLKLRLVDLKLSDPKGIVLVKAFQPVLDALQAMHAHRVSSVAVVDATDRLLGNISASDVKHIMRHLRYGVLFETCSQFIGGVKTRQMLDNAGKDVVPVIQVSPTAPLAQVLRLLVVTKVHRVWCVDQNAHSASFQAPSSVVSLTDILRILM
ncbi:hypothetical protein BC828DRAFT_369588 [Blastocladiella britannica]|nr:hypothetical protein BC828DRAFT_369588 [Blastocladiella britannica]